MKREEEQQTDKFALQIKTTGEGNTIEILIIINYMNENFCSGNIYILVRCDDRPTSDLGTCLRRNPCIRMTRFHKEFDRSTCQSARWHSERGREHLGHTDSYHLSGIQIRADRKRPQ